MSNYSMTLDFGTHGKRISKTYIPTGMVSTCDMTKLFITLTTSKDANYGGKLLSWNIAGIESSYYTNPVKSTFTRIKLDKINGTIKYKHPLGIHIFTIEFWVTWNNEFWKFCEL